MRLLPYVALPIVLWGCTPLEEQMEILVTNNHPSCTDAGKSILVTIMNPTDKQINSTSYQVIAKRLGYSSEVASENYATDYIIAPNGEASFCHSRPNNQTSSYTLQEARYSPYFNIPENELVFSGKISSAQPQE